jgi:hypothetical protein
MREPNGLSAAVIIKIPSSQGILSPLYGIEEDISFVFATAFLHEASRYHVEKVIAVEAVGSSSYLLNIPSYVIYGNAGFVGAEYIAFSSYAGKNCEKKFCIAAILSILAPQTAL